MIKWYCNKKCKDCNVEMIEDLGIRVNEQTSINNIFQFYIIKNPKAYYGKRISKDEVKCRIYPECGEVEPLC